MATSTPASGGRAASLTFPRSSRSFELCSESAISPTTGPTGLGWRSRFDLRTVRQRRTSSPAPSASGRKHGQRRDTRHHYRGGPFVTFVAAFVTAAYGHLRWDVTR